MRKRCFSHWFGDVPEGIAEQIPSANSDGIYRRWISMMDRCHNPKSKPNSVYKKRKISVAEEWHGLEGYFRFREWSLSHGYADDLVIDRIDGCGDYSPQNCRWVTKQQNNKNRISPKHIARTKPEDKTALYRARIKAGKSVQEVMAHMNVSDATIYYWECGQYFPKMDKLLRLAKFYDCSLDDLLEDIIHTKNTKEVSNDHQRD